MSNDTTVLVAFSVNKPNQEEAQAALLPLLPRPDSEIVDSWWVAEDDRVDGSDNDSAVFVNPGAQTDAFRLLYTHGLTRGWNNPNKGIAGQFTAQRSGEYTDSPMNTVIEEMAKTSPSLYGEEDVWLDMMKEVRRRVQAAADTLVGMHNETGFDLHAEDAGEFLNLVRIVYPDF